MLKLVLLSCLMSALAEASDDSKAKAKMYSLHTGFQPGSMNLSTGELKLFSGHAMNIIQAKCPAVDSKKIFQVQKYIGKLIAKNEPVPGTSKDFKGLLDTMTSCAKEGVIAKPAEPEMDEPRFPANFFPFFSPFHRIRNVFIQRLPKLLSTATDSPVVTEPKSESSVTNGLPGPVVEEGSSIVTPLDGSLPADQTKTSDPLPSSVKPPTRRVITTTIFVRPQDMQEGIRTSGGLINWIHKIMSRVGSFFSNNMPFGQRMKRDIADVSTTTTTLGDEPTIVSPYQIWSPEKDDSKGKKSFGILIDHMCRIYCDTCSGKKEIREFKMAAKQLLSQLFEEDSGLEVAAKQYLDDDFLNSIEKCE